MKFFITILAVLMPALSFAHGGHESIAMSAETISASIAAGLLHPLLGLDHLLSLIAVGLLVARLKGKQRFLIPVGFVSLMLVGFFSAHAGIHMVSAGAIEMLISLSLLTVAVLLITGRLLQANNRFNVMAAWAVTAFASIHGMAHGLEVPAGSSAVVFALGFAAACLAVIALTTLSLQVINASKQGTLA
jgi:urease accessory protein